MMRTYTLPISHLYLTLFRLRRRSEIGSSRKESRVVPQGKYRQKKKNVFTRNVDGWCGIAVGSERGRLDFGRVHEYVATVSQYTKRINCTATRTTARLSIKDYLQGRGMTRVVHTDMLVFVYHGISSIHIHNNSRNNHSPLLLLLSGQKYIKFYWSAPA
jgi:hypothetical protein